MSLIRKITSANTIGYLAGIAGLLTFLFTFIFSSSSLVVNAPYGIAQAYSTYDISDWGKATSIVCRAVTGTKVEKTGNVHPKNNPFYIEVKFLDGPCEGKVGWMEYGRIISSDHVH